MNKAIFTLLFLSVFVVFASPARSEDKDLAKLFADKCITGTIILSDLSGAKTYISDEHRANKAFVPASTFKILNTLIALEENVVSEKDIIKWDGKDKGLKAWNHDQTLESAFNTSCVWYYQELARRIGTARYKAYLKKVGYGTGLPTPELTTFWLDGDLKISAVEQVEFIKKIYRREFPFKHGSYEILKRVMEIEKTPAYTLRAKTGWGQRVTPQIGWFVGYVEAGDQVWFFATNLEIKKPEDARLRQQITLEALKLKGII
jgi:beta-lactamase class D